jgi:glycosyltransferase involved in cell wall biosynthesis
MPPAVAADPILKRFRAALGEIYGDRIERVVLFGSRARGDAATASDGPAGLIEDEVSGLLVPLPGQPGGGPRALARAIERLGRDPALRARLGQAGRRAYEAEFTEAAVVARYRRFFDRLMPGCAASPG